ncbi:MAG: PAS domain S-box protein [Ignavibacteria bacterium]|jgi:PAS domain S-box-containing protein|nr:PAS domain S-box protein [Ignavibacteria bacterium]MCU7518771.1 PAS domain S-box protein [Ignavibacteria bacterium]
MQKKNSRNIPTNTAQPDYSSGDICRTLIETSMDSIIIMDLDGVIKEVSPRTLEIHGYESTSELIGKKAADLIAPEDRPKVSHLRQIMLAEGENKKLELSFLKKGGLKFWGEVSTSLVKNSQGEGICFVSVLKDINKHRQEQKKQAAIFEISEAANSSKDLDELYAKVHAILKEFIPAENLYLALYDDMSETLTFPYYVDKYDSQHEKPGDNRRRKFGRGLTEYALRYGRPLLVTKEKYCELLDKNEVELLGAISIEWLGVPLKTYDAKKIGVLAVQIYDNENLRYTKEDEELLAFVSTQIAMAIERKRTEQVLQESQEASEAVISNLPDIVIVHKKGSIVFANNTAVDFWGYSYEELMNRSVLDLVAPDKKAFVAGMLSKRSQGRALPDYETEIVTKSGYRKSTVIRGVDMFYGKEPATLIVLIDVTERKENEAILAKFKQAVEWSNEAILITDPDGLITYVNPAFTELYGYSCKEVVGKVTPRILKSGFHTPEQYTHLWNLLKQKQPVQGEMVNKTKDGRLVPIEASASSILNESGNIIGYLGIQKDISDRKGSEKVNNALYKISEAVNTTSDLDMLYSKLHEIIKDLMPADNFYIAVYDQINELLSFPYFVDEFDPPQESKKVGKGLTEYVLRTGQGALINEEQDLALRDLGEVEIIGTPSKIWLGVPLKVMDKITGVMVVQDYENPDAYGEEEKEILTFVSEQIASAIYKKTVEQELLEYTTDLQTHRYLLEQRTEELTELNKQLEKSEKELQESLSEKDRFFSIIAHDLKSPFNGLMGFTNLLMQDFEQFSTGEVKNFIVHINTSVKNIYNLIENLLDWSRIQTGRMEFNPEALSLPGQVKPVFSLLKNNAITKGIKLEQRINKDIAVFADEKMLHCVLQNLISNAIKFTNPDGKITIAATKEDGHVKVSVTDTGVGIHPASLDKLFKIDSNLSTEGTAHEKGTGLGLILCKEFIEKNGGSISVDSKLNKGTTFTFTLPAVKSN